MTNDLAGTRVRVRLFAPGHDDFAASTTGTITSRVQEVPPENYHDGYEMRFDNPIVIEGVSVQDVYVVPTGRYPFKPGMDKMSDVLRESLYVIVSWSLPDGTVYTFGEKGTFAELVLLK